MTTNTEQFLKDIERHEILVYRDEGMYRHIRFKRPGSYTMHFDLITWPGYLCYTGDMGCYVFTRLDDMFEFFRRSDSDRKYNIDMRYWAEKVQAEDKGDGISQFSLDVFKAAVKDYFEQATTYEEDWPADKKAELWSAIELEVLDVDDEHSAWEAIRSFEYKDFEFTDWENQCKEYSFRFQWCCQALAWGIDKYDTYKKPIEESPMGAS